MVANPIRNFIPLDIWRQIRY